ncbi:MAG: tRNA uridine-5-carboxymethylaminomethyl(34) synthesis GTPase MnmE [Bacteroidetes bacterium]|nr:tRNA uridine-5-carboxymethylaminomethyl(34) synthesis GTPase MnmE [Rhodothermia bacterium]MCS7154626.1 tRNA uridine-5-carboxymethylaminomethyl(34) synthesis GTPase MnmE [Bacteroidota bacterium]MCX7906343.1 tRNA uridine-5-carboxymethylaminomethyl(34) synthesis GTPase MnmE [Bacteroidota bacterium]MDW8285627.1 tRNA uridine-5-carboxymethylaminomethyl(34) synthesis GTPase MnmE [Bacteroidota bacterium]
MRTYLEQEPICALATAPGQGALAVIRVSGKGAIALVASHFQGKDLRTAPSHTAHFGRILDAQGRTIDTVVVTLFRAPRSYTGEDVVEISAHGGWLVSRLILETLMEAGCRPAEPGEFTRRAFLNGKLDLAQAEAVADLIQASSRWAHQVSIAHLEGKLSERLRGFRDRLLHLVAMLELELDFAEEDVEFADRAELLALLESLMAELEALVSSFALGQVIREGVVTAIAGRPNAGKSTLLNQLVGRDRAIVSEIPGTTRDLIEEQLQLDGLLFRLFDTAGIRETGDVIEEEGVRRTLRILQEAHLLLYVYDATVGWTEEEKRFLEAYRLRHPEKAVLVLANKVDRLPPGYTLSDATHLPISAQTGWGLDRLRQAMRECVIGAGVPPEASGVITNARHHAALRRALEALNQAQEAFRAGRSSDLLVVPLKAALHELGTITGEVTTEDVLAYIFARFCIGK